MRFFLSEKIEGIYTKLTGSENHHLIHVYRAKPGMEVELFNAQGELYLARVIACQKEQTNLQIINTMQEKPHWPFQITLAQGVFKSQHWDLLLEKCMELGLYRLIPMTTQHIAAGNLTAGRNERWQKVMIAAAKQCKRTSLIQIDSVQSFEQMLASTKQIPLRVLAHTGPELPSFKKILDCISPMPPEILAIVGPEGGFSQTEIELAIAHNIQLFSLGPYVLRAETAAWAVISSLNFYLQA